MDYSGSIHGEEYVIRPETMWVVNVRYRGNPDRIRSSVPAGFLAKARNPQVVICTGLLARGSAGQLLSCGIPGNQGAWWLSDMTWGNAGAGGGTGGIGGGSGSGSGWLCHRKSEYWAFCDPVRNDVAAWTITLLCASWRGADQAMLRLLQEIASIMIHMFGRADRGVPRARHQAISAYPTEVAPLACALRAGILWKLLRYHAEAWGFPGYSLLSVLPSVVDISLSEADICKNGMW